MKKSIILYLLLACFAVCGQNSPMGVNRIESGNQMSVGQGLEYDNQPLYPEYAQRAYIRDKKGKWYLADAAQYDAQSNNVVFMVDEELKRPAFTVLGFVLGDSTTGKPIHQFERGFPSVAENDVSTFYEVLFNGKTKLLKCIKAKVMDVTSYNSATKKLRFEFIETYFIQTPEGEMKTVKKDKKVLKEALPSYEGILDRGKIRTWNDVVILFAEAER